MDTEQAVAALSWIVVAQGELNPIVEHASWNWHTPRGIGVNPVEHAQAALDALAEAVKLMTAD